MTNFEKIKQTINEMDEADMAEWIDEFMCYAHLTGCRFCTEDYCHCDGKCVRHIRKWLKQEVNEDAKIHYGLRRIVL